MKSKRRRAKEASAGQADRDYLETLITEQEAAAFLGLSVRFLQNRRTRGGGPTFVGISRRCVRYRRRELIAWSNALSKAHTSEIGEPGVSEARRGRVTADPEAEERS